MFTKIVAIVKGIGDDYLTLGLRGCLCRMCYLQRSQSGVTVLWDLPKIHFLYEYISKVKKRSARADGLKTFIFVFKIVY